MTPSPGKGRTGTAGRPLPFVAQQRRTSGRLGEAWTSSAVVGAAEPSAAPVSIAPEANAPAKNPPAAPPPPPDQRPRKREREEKGPPVPAGRSVKRKHAPIVAGGPGPRFKA